MIIEFDASSGIRTAKMIRDKLMKAIREQECICDFSNVSRIDASVAQLIISAMKEGKKTGVKIKIRGLSDEVKTQFDLCGLRSTAKTEKL